MRTSARRTLDAACTFSLLTGALADRLLSAQPSGPKRTILLTADLPDFKGKEAQMWITEIAPGAQTDHHSHPGYLFGYVLEGSLVHTVDEPGAKPRTFTVGQTWEELPGQVHWARNASATAPVKLLAVGVLTKGQPISSPAKPK